LRVTVCEVGAPLVKPRTATGDRVQRAAAAISPGGGGRVLCRARLEKNDTLIVAKLDRAFRNAANALVTAEALKAHKVDLVIADMGEVKRRGGGHIGGDAPFEHARTRETEGGPRAAKGVVSANARLRR
jgi:hypothetical protein